MFARDNNQIQRVLDGVDLVIDFTTLGEYGLATESAADEAKRLSDCERRTRRERNPRTPLRRRRRGRRPNGRGSESAPGSETYSFDFPTEAPQAPLILAARGLA